MSGTSARAVARRGGTGRVLCRLLLVLASVLVALKGGDLLLGAIDPAGISYFADQDAFAACVEWTTVGDTFRLHRLKPNCSVDAGVQYTTNALGFRDRERAQPKPPDTFRIVAIGDSVTFGWGVPVEARFTNVVEARLNERFAARGDPRRVEVVNLAVPGYEAPHQFFTFRDVALGLEPDVVLYFFVANDVQVFTDEAKPFAAAAPTGVRKLAHRLSRASLVATALPHVAALLKFAAMDRSAAPDRATHVASFAAMTRGIAHAADVYRQSMKRARKNGSAFAVFGLEPFAPIGEACARAGVPYRLLVPPGSTDDPGLRNSATDAHPNATGHALVAEHLLAALDEMHLVP